METKTCTKCGRELPLSEFHANSKTKDGKVSQCKDCINRYFHEYYNRKKINPHRGGGENNRPFSDPDFDGKENVEVIQMMGRAKRWLESRGYVITLKGEYHETKIRQVKFQ